MKIKHLTYILIFSIAFIFTACEKPFGDKTDLGFIDVPTYDEQPIAFVPILPEIKLTGNPQDITVGYDELIYIADPSTNKIISFDQSGRKVSERTLQGVKAIAMDRSLELLAVGTKDTLINGVTYTLDAIYRLQLSSSSGYGLANARITKTIIHPFYFKTSFTTSDTAVHINGISVMADNNYYVTRTGPSNSIAQIGGPDDAVLVFNQNDKFVTTVNVQTEQGLIADYFKKPFAISTLAKAPQSTNVKTGGDFLFSSISNSTSLKVQYIRFESSDFGSSFTLNTSLAGQDTSKADGFIYTPNRFINPRGVTIAGDGSNFIFVSDAAKDSVYLFTLNGLEGVQPPPGYASKKNIKVSFGGRGAGAKQFRNPGALAYYGQTLYVCDAGNGRILRFKLSTEFDNN
jgi:hypothetical protein